MKDDVVATNGAIPSPCFEWSDSETCVKQITLMHSNALEYRKTLREEKDQFASQVRTILDKQDEAERRNLDLLGENKELWDKFTSEDIRTLLGSDFILPDEYKQYEPEVKKLFIAESGNAKPLSLRI